MHLKRLLAGFFLIGYLSTASAQTNECEQTLSQASEEFNAGHFYGIPALLKTCIDRNNFTNEQRVRAYLLLCQAYLIIDDPIAAEDSYLKLLRADPEYVATNEKDPIDVVYLSKKFTSTPIFTPHVRIGGNTSLFRTIHDINTQTAPLKSILKPGYQFGGGLDWNINDKISLCVDGIFSFKSFKTVRSGISDNDKLTVTENQTWFDVPLYIKYTVDHGQIRPYGYIGGAVNVLLGSKASMELINISPSEESQSPSQGQDVTLTYLRRITNRSLVMGGGVRYKIGKDFLFADLRYMAGFSNLSNKDQIYKPDPKQAQNPAGLVMNPELTRYRQVDSMFRLDNLSLSVGYVRPLYNPRKIRNARGAKILSKKIRKQTKE